MKNNFNEAIEKADRLIDSFIQLYKFDQKLITMRKNLDSILEAKEIAEGLAKFGQLDALDSLIECNNKQKCQHWVNDEIDMIYQNAINQVCGIHL